MEENKIICRLSPVTQSSITVVDKEGNQLKNTICEAKDFSQTLFSIANEYKAKDSIYFYGPKTYTSGLLKVMEKENLTNYNFYDYKITLM